MRRRRRTAYLIVALTVCVGGSLMLAGTAAAIDLEPFVQFLDHGITPKVDEVATDAIEGSTKLPDYFGSEDTELERSRLALGFDPEEEAPTPEEIRNDTDWCLWSALANSAGQLSDGDNTASDGTSLSPTQILYSNLSACLESHITDPLPGQITALTNTLVFANEVQLVQSQSNLNSQAAAGWVVDNGLTFDPNTWIDWFNFKASTVPPV